MDFYLGTHEPSWLRRTSVPLFVSRRRLARLAEPPRAWSRWGLDSGGFTELFLHGKWTVEPARYADEAARWADRIGNLDFAAIQDWMCEPFMLTKTGKTIREHQELSVQSSLDLATLAPSVPWAPVLQGWLPDDYLAHAEMYRAAGVDLASAPRVGVGSVCRRQGQRAAEEIFAALRPLGLRLHGFGLKTGFVRLAVEAGVESCDSMAWSLRARRSPPLPGCHHRSCANCFHFAMMWRNRLLSGLRRSRQTTFGF